MVFFLPDRKAPAQRHTRSSANVAWYAACRGGLMVDDGSYTKDRNDRKIRKPNKNSPQRQASAYLSRKKKTPYILYLATTCLPTIPPLLPPSAQQSTIASRKHDFTTRAQIGIHTKQRYVAYLTFNGSSRHKRILTQLPLILRNLSAKQPKRPRLSPISVGHLQLPTRIP